MRLFAALSASLARVLSPGARARDHRAAAAALLDSLGGDVMRATRWCNAEMRRAEAERAPARARRALALRRACGALWAERIGARPTPGR